MLHKTSTLIFCFLILFVSSSKGEQNQPIVISPFIDVSYDIGSDNWYYYNYGYDRYTNDGANLSFGLNIFRKPLYLQFQLANCLKGFSDEGDYFGIAKLGMVEQMTKNGFIEMNFSYTDNFNSTRYGNYKVYSGSVGYYHLFPPIDTLSSAYFSLGINLGFVNYNYVKWYVDPGWYPPYPAYYYRNQTAMFTVAEFSWINKYLRPYIAFGLKNLVNDYDYIYPRNSGFFTIGIQAQLTDFLPYVSGNQTKLTYHKQNYYRRWYYTMPRKPNIYLYPETTMQVKVKLTSEKGNEVTISIPSYNNGWEVTADPSGIIDGKYEYLFYEGSKIKYQPSSFGWSVTASDLWQFLPAKMSVYGFNNKEIKDFVDYWQEHLPKSDYYDIIPLVNHEIENEYSLIIDPEPDAVMRVWFYINPTDNKKDMPAPLIQKFERKGFSVVEWGVLLK